MKTPFKKLRGLGLHRQNTHRSPAQLDELSQASQDMHDMKDCYDSLLSAAAATANSAYEFSESLREMGDCLLEKTSLNDDEESGRVLLMLGKVQFEVQKLVDNYRAHISRTITAPSESLLSELRVVEEMKRQCEEKRTTYDEMKKRHKDKRSSNQLRAAQKEFDEDATLFVFRMKSLKKGQSRSLLTQAARHHAAQMCFFKKALKSLETIEPHVKLVTQQQYIDYQFSGLEDDDDRDSVFLTDEDEEDSHEEDDGELSFEYQRGDPKNEQSMELGSAADITFPQVKVDMEEQRKNSSTFGVELNLNAGSKSAPLTAAAGSGINMMMRKMRQSSARKLNTYVLPTPNNLWHSSPLVRMKYDTKDKSALLKENIAQISAKKTKIYAFSGPLQSNKSSSSTGTRASFVSSPKISELHELPRPPPANLPPSKAAFSAPLVSFANKSPPRTRNT
ncbi:hypothetical protein LXL04_011752 [Taraxacum kok-saghyz]